MALKKQVKTEKRKSPMTYKYMVTGDSTSNLEERNQVRKTNVAHVIHPTVESKGKTLSEKEVFVPDPTDCWI